MRSRFLRFECLEARLALNGAPMAEADSYITSTTGSRTLTVDAASGVLANDSDPESDPLHASLIQGPPNAETGTFSLNQDGSFTYKPKKNWVGSDEFTYSVSDGCSSAMATVQITVPQLKVSVVPFWDIGIGVDPLPSEWTEASNDDLQGFYVYLDDGPVDFDVTVPFVVSQIPPPGGGQPAAITGHAILNVDYQLSAQTNVTIPANQHAQTIQLTVLPDKYVEGDELVAIQLQTPQNVASVYTLTDGSASTNIKDNDSWDWDNLLELDSYPTETLDPAYGDLWPWDSTFTSTSSYIAHDNRLDVDIDSYWLWYERWLLIEMQWHEHNMHRELNIEFEFDALTGKITPVSGSGLDGDAPEVDSAFNDIEYSYVLDNSGDYLKTATVSFSPTSGVRANYTHTNTVGVAPSGKIGDGVEVGVSGKWDITYSLTGTDGGLNMQYIKQFVFKLRSVEPAT